MRTALIFLFCIISVQSMAAEVVRSKNGKYSCEEGGKLIASGKDELFATTSPIVEGNRCVAFKSQKASPNSKSKESSEIIVFGPHQAPRSVRFGFRFIF
jgi:hypothetical protein